MSKGRLAAGHPRRRDAGDDLALEDSIENQDGHRRDKRSGEGQPALDVAPLLQHQQADGEPDLPGEDDEQPEKVVPEAKEAKDGKRGERIGHQRQADLPKDAEAPCAVNARGVLQLGGNRIKVLAQEKDARHLCGAVLLQRFLAGFERNLLLTGMDEQCVVHAEHPFRSHPGPRQAGQEIQQGLVQGFQRVGTLRQQPAEQCRTTKSVAERYWKKLS